MKPITVVVHGAMGKMGKTVINAVCQEPETRSLAQLISKLPAIVSNYRTAPAMSPYPLTLIVSLPVKNRMYW